MGKGMFILIAIGIGFIFLATDLVKNVDDSPSSGRYSMSGSENTEIQRYLKDNPAGYQVFDPSSLNLEKAKKLWNNSELKQEMMDYFPKFELMKEYVRLHVVDGKFADRLVSKIAEAEATISDRSSQF